MREEAESLAEALATRKIVERAKGILMEREGLSENDAFVRLRRASQSSGTPSPRRGRGGHRDVRQ